MLTSQKKRQLWQLYLNGIKSRAIPSLEVLGVTGLRFSNERGFIQTLSREQQQELDVVKELMASWEQQKGIEAMDRTKKLDEQKIVELGVEFVNAAATPKKLDRMKEIYAAGLPINFQHPRHLSTALHRAAGTNNEEAVRWLVSMGECDYLLLDTHKRMACDRLRLRFPHEEELNTLLSVETYKQAQEQGLDFAKDQAERMREWQKFDLNKNIL